MDSYAAPTHVQKVVAQQGDKTIIKTKPRIERNRVLVTGGAGFVGSHLCTYLVERGDHVSSPQSQNSSMGSYIVCGLPRSNSIVCKILSLLFKDTDLP